MTVTEAGAKLTFFLIIQSNGVAAAVPVVAQFPGEGLDSRWFYSYNPYYAQAAAARLAHRQQAAQLLLARNRATLARQRAAAAVMLNSHLSPVGGIIGSIQQQLSKQ